MIAPNEIPKQHPGNRAKASRVRLRRDKVCDLLLKGVFSQKKIAEILGEHRTTICRDIAQIEQQWHAEAMEKYDRYKAKKLLELDAVKEEAWEAWERSKGKFHRITSKTRGEGEESGTREITTTVEERVGDARFLSVVKDCIDKQAELAGLKVHKIAPTDPTGREQYGVYVMEKIIKLAEEVGEGAEIIDVDYVRRIAEETEAAKDGEAEATRAVQNEEQTGGQLSSRSD